MYYLSNFCCVCINNNQDLRHLDENSKLLNKLKYSVPEITFHTKCFALFICYDCRKELRQAYSLKKRIIESHLIIESYVEMLQNGDDESNKNGELEVLLNLYKKPVEQKENVEEQAESSRPKKSKSKKDSKREFDTEISNYIMKEFLSGPALSDISINTESEILENNLFEPDDFSHVAQENGNEEKNTLLYENNELISENSLQVKSEVKDEIIEITEDSLEVEHTERSNSDSVIISDTNTENNNIESKDNTEIFKCPLCSIIFKFKSQLIKHMGRHTNRNFKCSVPMCNKSYASNKNLKQHLKMHTGKMYKSKITCTLCDKKFISKAGLKSHVRASHVGKKYKCKICGKKYINYGNLQLHISHFHKPSNNKTYECHLCHKKFEVKSDFKQHVSTHDKIKRFKCDICTKGFVTQFLLQEHIIIHTNKIFKCTICNKGFDKNSSLRSHIKSHNLKPYNCNLCSSNFKSRSDLNKHTVDKHNNKILECSVCNQTFTQQRLLNAHLYSHISELENFV